MVGIGKLHKPAHGGDDLLLMMMSMMSMISLNGCEGLCWDVGFFGADGPGAQVLAKGFYFPLDFEKVWHI